MALFAANEGYVYMGACMCGGVWVSGNMQCKAKKKNLFAFPESAQQLNWMPT